MRKRNVVFMAGLSAALAMGTITPLSVYAEAAVEEVSAEVTAEETVQEDTNGLERQEAADASDAGQDAVTEEAANVQEEASENGQIAAEEQAPEERQAVPVSQEISEDVRAPEDGSLEQEAFDDVDAPASEEKLKELENAVSRAREIFYKNIFLDADEEVQESFFNAFQRAEGMLKLPNLPARDADRAMQDLKDAESALNGRASEDLQKEIERGELVKRSIRYKRAPEQERESYDKALKDAGELLEKTRDNPTHIPAPLRKKTIEEEIAHVVSARDALTGSSPKTEELKKQISEAETAKSGKKYQNAGKDFQRAYDETLRTARAVQEDEWASEEDTDKNIEALKKKEEALRALYENGNAGNQQNGGSGKPDGSRKSGGGNRSGRSNRSGGGGSGRSAGSARQAGSSILPVQTVMTNRASLNAGKWVNVNGKWRLELRAADGTRAGFASAQWAKLDSKWYLFGQDEYMCTGLVRANNASYYFDASGAMQTGWLSFNNKWYYFDELSGAMRTGWLNQDGKWYFLKADGSMAVNEMISDGHKVGADGVWMK